MTRTQYLNNINWLIRWQSDQLQRLEKQAADLRGKPLPDWLSEALSHTRNLLRIAELAEKRVKDCK